MTPENKIKFNFDKFPEVMGKILTETIEVQLSKSPARALKFIEDNSDWSSLHEYIAQTLQNLGIKPYKDIRTYL